MNARQALAFVKRHGVVLMSGRGPVPSLAEAVVGEPIRGSWWSHPRAREIFRACGAVTGHDDILTCRLVGGKVTFVHRRLWPALVRLAPDLAPGRVASLREEHGPLGRHRVIETPFPVWVPAEVADAARDMAPAEATEGLGEALGARITRTSGSPSRGRRSPRDP